MLNECSPVKDLNGLYLNSFMTSEHCCLVLISEVVCFDVSVAGGFFK